MKSVHYGDLLDKLNDLATISPIAIELINKIGQPDTSREEIARLVENDEVIYANVFKYTKSAAMGLVRVPETINEAIDILGGHGLLNLIFIIAAKRVFLNLQLWQKSLYTAHLAKNIAEQLNYDSKQTSDVYIATLMHFMGLLVFKTFYTADYRAIEQMQIQNINDYNQVNKAEREVFGLSGAELSYEIGISYKLPDRINNILKTQTYDWQASEFTQDNAIILSARLISDLECTDQKDLDEALDITFLSRFGLEAISLDSKFFTNLEKNISELAKCD